MDRDDVQLILVTSGGLCLQDDQDGITEKILHDLQTIDDLSIQLVSSWSYRSIVAIICRLSSRQSLRTNGSNGLLHDERCRLSS